MLLVLAAVLYLPGLGSTSFWDRDEPRFAGTVQEFERTGDWIVPRFNGELRPDKPILSYWAMAASVRMFGPSEFAYRLPSAVSIGLAGVVLYGIGVLLFSPVCGVVAAAILILSPLALVMGHLCTADAQLLLWTLTAIWGGLRLYRQGTCTSGWFALWGGLGLGALTKGPVILVVVLLILGVVVFSPRTAPRLRGSSSAGMSAILLVCALTVLLLLGSGNTHAAVVALVAFWAVALGLVLRLGLEAEPSSARKWALVLTLAVGAQLWGLSAVLPALGLLAICWLKCDEPARLRRFDAPRGVLFMLALVALWVLPLVFRTGGEFLRQSLGRHVVARSVRPLEGHSGPIVYYLLLLPLLFFPWSCYLPKILEDAWHARKTPELKILLGWLAATLGFFSCVGTKLPHYILPAIPALALLAGWWLEGWAKGRFKVYEHAWPERALKIMALGITSLVTLGVTLSTSWVGFDEHWQVFFAVPVLGFTMAVPAVQDFRLGRAARSFVVMGFGSACLALVVFTEILPSLETYRSTKGLANTVRLCATDDIPVVAYGFREPSFIFYTDERVQVAGRRDDLARLVARHGHILAVVKGERWENLVAKRKDLRFRVITDETLFNVAKGRWEHVVVCRISRAAPPPAAAARTPDVGASPTAPAD